MPHVNVDLICVGWENFSSDDINAVNDATWSARQIYWQVGFDLFGWWTYSIPVADAQGYSCIDQDSEAEWLTDMWSIPAMASTSSWSRATSAQRPACRP